MGKLSTGGLGLPKLTQLASRGADSNSRALPPHPPPCLPEEAIYRFLEAHGPCKALNIAKGVGKKIAKDVNRDLYDMRKQHKLDFDEKTSTWAIYQPGR